MTTNMAAELRENPNLGGGGDSKNMYTIVMNNEITSLEVNNNIVTSGKRFSKDRQISLKFSHILRQP